MEPKRARIFGALLGLIGILGVINFLRGFMNPLSELTTEDLLLVKLPFITAILLIVASTGLLLLKKWSCAIVRLTMLLWVCSGVAAVRFAWTFHPWGDPPLLDKIRLASGFMIGGIILPTFGFFGLRYVVSKPCN